MAQDCGSIQESIGNARIRVEARSGPNGLRVAICARSGDRWVEVLERAETAGRQQDAEARALRAEWPTECAVRTETAGDRAYLLIDGRTGAAAHHISLAVQGDAPWVEAHELLVTEAATPADAPEVEWFEAVWRFVDWREPGEVFTPLLVPLPGDVIGRHALRSPALTAQSGGRAAALVGNPDLMAKEQALPACMGFSREHGTPVLCTGLRGHVPRGHVYFTHAPGTGVRQPRLYHAYYLGVMAQATEGAALGAANRLLWARHGARLSRQAMPLPQSFAEYALQAYPRALQRLWAETEIDGRRVGAIREHRSYPDDVWMSTWFSQIRSAYGLYLWGQWLGRKDWVAQALATRDLHLAAPQEQGLFPTVCVFVDASGPAGPSGAAQRFTGCRWVHSHHQGGGPGIYHVSDMSWTAWQLLRWHRDLVRDERTVAFVRGYARGLLDLQRPDGGLPAYVDARTRAPVARVDRQALLDDLAAHPGGDSYVSSMLARQWVVERFERSAEDGSSLLLLADLYRALPDGDPERPRFLEAATRLAGAIEAWVYPEARWIDAEVYFSCSPKPLDFYDARSGQWPQNTLCMHLTAAGFLALHGVTGAPRHLALARRALDRLSLYQQVWDPPFLHFRGVGGYGVMNTDGEWSDARQAQFADTHLDFHRATGEQEQLERAQAACRAGFVTWYLAANAAVYPTGWCQQPAGMAAENHAHGGADHLCGVSGFDWGVGSALATAAYLRRHGALPADGPDGLPVRLVDGG